MLVRQSEGLFTRARWSKARATAALACAMMLLAGVMLFVSGLDAAAQEVQPPVVATDEPPSPSEPAEKPLAKSTLRGHVTYEGTGRPVRRARILLLTQNKSGGELLAMTDAHGDFQVKNVPEGKYFVMVNSAGVVTPVSLMDIDLLKGDSMDFSEIRKQFDEVSVDGINDKDVEVRAHMGGAISGRVTYPDGDPAINVRVDIMRRRYGHLARFITNINPSAFLGLQTDDRGFYRFSGLPPGEYIVSASENITHGDARRGGEAEFMPDPNSLVITYYQNATSVRNATPVKIDGAEDEKNIDITLSDRALYTVSGTVRSRRDNRPLAQARITLISKENSGSLAQVMPYSEYLQPTVETDETGQWTFKEIPDGDYTLIVAPPYGGTEMTATSPLDSPGQSRMLSRNRKKLSQKQLDVKVAGRDVTGMSVEMVEGARLSGTVMVEGGGPIPESLTVYTRPAEGEGPPSVSQSNVDGNGNFGIDGVPGGKVYLSIYSPENKYYVKSIQAGGADVTHGPLVVQESSEIAGVRIVISSESGVLTGHVLDAPGGTGVGGVNVLLYPVDPAEWSHMDRIIGAQSDASGLFSLSGAPGEYLVMVFRTSENPEMPGEEFVKSRAATAPRVTLRPKERKSLDLVAPPRN